MRKTTPVGQPPARTDVSRKLAGSGSRAARVWRARVRPLVPLTVAVVALMPTPPAAATTDTLDQHQEDVSVCCPSLGGPYQLAQTFTAGETGVIDRVELYVSSATFAEVPPLRVTVQTATGVPPRPTGTILGSGVLTTGDYRPGWRQIPLSVPAPVDSGLHYALVASSAGAWVWQGSSDDAYADGTGFFEDPEWQPDGLDFAFRTYVATPADVSVDLTAPATAKTKSSIAYSIDVFNAGPGTAEQVVLTDALPDGTQYASATSNQGSCTPPGNKVRTVTCQLGPLPSRLFATISITVKITARPSQSPIKNVVSVSSATPDEDPSNNTASASTTVTR